MLVAVLGCDGSGKSTVIEQAGTRLKPEFAGVCCLHLRPHLRTRRKDQRAADDPHGAPPRGWLASCLKLFYFALDYNLGHLIKVRPHLRRSALVLFDRYCHDLLIDPRRYRYGGPMGLARLLARLVPQPDLWVVLDAPEHTLLARKREVAVDELRRQRRAYRAFAAERESRAVLIGVDRALDEVVDDVAAAVRSRAGRRRGR